MTAPGLTFSARDADALDILQALGDDARRAMWRLDRWVEATGTRHADALHARSADRGVLARIAARYPGAAPLPA